MIESHGDQVKWITYILSKHKGNMMRMIFHNEKTELNKLPKSLFHQEHVSFKFMLGKNRLQG